MGKVFEEEDCLEPEKNGYKEVFISAALLVIGTETNDEAAYGFFLYIFMCFAFVIVMLNLLIAIVQDSYDKVQDNSIPLRYVERCTLMLDVE